MGNYDWSNEGFSLSIEGNDCHTQRIATNIILNFKTCINEFLKQKKCMLQKGRFSGL